MKQFPAALEAALEAGRICRIVRVTLTDSTVLAYCNHDKPLTLDGSTFQPMPGDLAGSAVQRVGTSVDNQVFNLTWDGTEEQDLIDGRYDDARVELGVAGWEDPTNAWAWLHVYDLGKLAWNRDGIQVDLMGTMRILGQPIGGSFSPRCRNILGDALCGVNLPGTAVGVTVTAVSQERMEFSDSGRSEPEHWYSDGRITWTSGANSGHTYTVEYSNGPNFTLQLPTRRPMAVGDTAQMTPGCNHGDDCRHKFGNTPNFNGWPFLRGETTVQ